MQHHVPGTPQGLKNVEHISRLTSAHAMRDCWHQPRYLAIRCTKPFPDALHQLLGGATHNAQQSPAYRIALRDTTASRYAPSPNTTLTPNAFCSQVLHPAAIHKPSPLSPLPTAALHGYPALRPLRLLLHVPLPRIAVQRHARSQDCCCCFHRRRCCCCKLLPTSKFTHRNVPPTPFLARTVRRPCCPLLPCPHAPHQRQPSPVFPSRRTQCSLGRCWARDPRVGPLSPGAAAATAVSAAVAASAEPPSAHPTRRVAPNSSHPTSTQPTPACLQRVSIVRYSNFSFPLFMPCHALLCRFRSFPLCGHPPHDVPAPAAAFARVTLLSYAMSSRALLGPRPAGRSSCRSAVVGPAGTRPPGLSGNREVW